MLSGSDSNLWVLGIVIPLAVYFLTRASFRQNKGWSSLGWISVATWVSAAIIAYWVINNVIWPYFFW